MGVQLRLDGVVEKQSYLNANNKPKEYLVD